jgi:hypothetical protein
VVTLIEQRARDLNVPLTSHDRAAERAQVLAQHVDAILESFRRDGQLKAFNRCYKAHRVAMNGHAPSYAIVVSDLRAEVIRVLVEHPRELSAAVLTQRLRHRFPWYQWFGN